MARDEFNAETKRTLARRVGDVCSNPGCRNGTAGPHSDHTKSVNRGKACHITAAAPGGARFDPSLSSGERSSINNGIWLCDDCADMVDKDSQLFSVARLHSWKHAAEQSALARGTTRSPATERDRVLLELPIKREELDGQSVARLLASVEDLTGYESGLVVILQIRSGSTLVSLALPFGGGEFLVQKLQENRTILGVLVSQARLLARVHRKEPQLQSLDLADIAGPIGVTAEEKIEGWDLVDALVREVSARLRSDLSLRVLIHLAIYGETERRELASMLQVDVGQVGSAQQEIRREARAALVDLGFGDLVSEH